MAQASWNLCPQSTAYSAGCYFTDDQKFGAIAGAVHTTLTDVPDGTWSLVVKRDLMGKVKGAVRSTAGVKRAAVWAKVGVCGAVGGGGVFDWSIGLKIPGRGALCILAVDTDPLLH
jgi:hypothetical protein